MFEYSHFVENQKKLYREIGVIPCPAIGNKPVHFNNRGFTHLLRKNGRYRSISEIKSRFELLKDAIHIVSKSTKIHSHRSVKIGKSLARFWALEKSIGANNVRVIIRQINDGNLHFFSVMVRNT